MGILLHADSDWVGLSWGPVFAFLEFQFLSAVCGNGLTDIGVLTPGTCDVPVWQRVFADEILDGETILDYPGGVLNIIPVLKKGRQREI